MKVLRLDELFVMTVDGVIVMDGVDASGGNPEGLCFVIEIDDDAKHRIVANLGIPGEVSLVEENVASDGEWWPEHEPSIPVSDAAILALADLIRNIRKMTR